MTVGKTPCRFLDRRPDMLRNRIDLHDLVDQTAVGSLVGNLHRPVVGRLDGVDLIPDPLQVEGLIRLVQMKVKTTSFAVKASPSDHFTPSRSLKVTLFRSSE